jgi:hypothetical protein
MTTPVSLDTVARLHQVTTGFHVFIYVAREATDSYAREGVHDRAGYFASRTAAMGALPPEMVMATFYNFNPELVATAMEGVWNTTTAEKMQLARWRAVAEILDKTCRHTLSETERAEAIEIAQRAVNGLRWDGRPLAAGNAATMRLLENSDFADDDLVRLWQLVTIIREWRGDTHIGLLITEPLTGVECTVVTHARQGGFTKASRSWPEEAWDTAVAGLADRGWLVDEDTLTDKGLEFRKRLEHRTNELSAPIWNGMDEATVNRLGDLLQPLVDDIAQHGYLKPFGIRPKEPAKEADEV